MIYIAQWDKYKYLNTLKILFKLLCRSESVENSELSLPQPCSTRYCAKTTENKRTSTRLPKTCADDVHDAEEAHAEEEAVLLEVGGGRDAVGHGLHLGWCRAGRRQALARRRRVAVQPLELAEHHRLLKPSQVKSSPAPQAL